MAIIAGGSSPRTWRGQNPCHQHKQPQQLWSCAGAIIAGRPELDLWMLAGIPAAHIRGRTDLTPWHCSSHGRAGQRRIEDSVPRASLLAARTGSKPRIRRSGVCGAYMLLRERSGIRAQVPFPAWRSADGCAARPLRPPSSDGRH